MQDWKKWAGCLLLTFLASPAQSTTLPQLKVEDLFKEADVVVIAEIQSGHRVSVGEFSCGAKYEAEIIHTLKGELEDQSIVEFGPFEGYGIGEKYLLFLKARGSRFDPVTSTNGIALAARAEYAENCASSEAAYNIMFHGMGALEISFTTKFDYNDAIKFHERWVLPPASLERKPAEADDNKVPSTESWVREDAFVEYIRGLKN